MLALTLSLSALVGVAVGWAARTRLRRPATSAPDTDSEFTAQFDALAQHTPLDWDTLAGPGPSPETAHPAPTVPAESASTLEARALSQQDIEYYADSWRNVSGEFSVSPSCGLSMAEHMTANLLLNRGLVPADTSHPSKIPDTWTFATARGYRQAQHIAAQADDARKDADSQAEYTDALRLFEAFYREVLELPSASAGGAFSTGR